MTLPAATRVARASLIAAVRGARRKFTAQALGVFAGITHMVLLGAGAITQFAISPAHAATMSGLGPATHASLLVMSGTAAAFFAIMAGRQSRPALQRATVETNHVSRDWSELMARTSHDLRTPLNAVIGFTDVMHRELLGPIGHDRYREYIGHIRDASLDLLKSTEDTLAITAIVTNPTGRSCSTFNLTAMLQSAWDNTSPRIQSGGVELDLQVDRHLTTQGNEPALHQAMVHLLSEAVQRAEPGTKIQMVGIENGDAQQVCIKFVTAGTTDRTPHLNDAPQDQPSDTVKHLPSARLMLELADATLNETDHLDKINWLVSLPHRASI